MRLTRVGSFSLQWGESVRWDDRVNRLYFVDCARQTLHWLDAAAPPLHSAPMPSLPTGVVLTNDEARVLVALDDGLHVVDVEHAETELLVLYPEELGGRANDARADFAGNVITGTLNMGPTTDGSYWSYSAVSGWRKLDDGIANANGPVVLDLDGIPTLIFADTFASVLYAYDYDGDNRTVGERRVFAKTAELGGMPDGACADSSGGVWSCVLGAGKIARYTGGGLDQTIDSGVEFPSDVTFGGDKLDRLFFVSIAVPIAGIEITSRHAGALMSVEDLEVVGRPEPRFHL